MKDIQGYEGLYAIEANGTIWAYPNRVNKLKMTKKVHTRDSRGYASVLLSKKGRCIRKSIHRLVAKHFVDGRTDEKKYVNHKDGNKMNPHYENLEWVTASENNKHAISAGLVRTNTDKQKIGRRKGGLMTCRQNAKANRKITFAEAECIRQIKKYCKVPYLKLARLYHLSDKTIANICNYKTYQEA